MKEPKVKDETSSDSEDKIMMKSSMAKRKGEMEGAEVVEKKKKGRPRKDAKMMPISQAFPQVTFLLQWMGLFRSLLRGFTVQAV